MTASDIPRLVTPLFLAVAIVLSAPRREPPRPVELQAGEPPPPGAAQLQSALGEVSGPSTPGYDRGAARAAVTVLEFADFGCPYCARFAAGTYPALAREFVATGQVRWKYVPFTMGMFPNGDLAARAAECAAAQGGAAFGRMHDRLYARQDEWKAAGDGEAAGLFRAYGRAARLDAARFDACFAGAAAGTLLAAANDVADRLGVRATPTFFVNGYRIEGALPPEQFRAVLQAALREARTR